MGQKSNIQWTDATWNVAVGCRKVDGDCKFCYMYRGSYGGNRYNPREIRKTTSVFRLPLQYKETKSAAWDGPPLIFTSSLTDFFIEEIDGYRNECWDIIRKCKHLTFQILTKRPERINECLPEDWGHGWDNVWLGTSVGHQAGMKRAHELVRVNAKVKFLSLEPLRGRIDLDETFFSERLLRNVPKKDWTKLLDLIDWVIVGGESGNDNGFYKYRPCELEWFESIIAQCREKNVPVFVKQLGTHLAKKLVLRDRHGGDIEEFPEHLQIREFPRLIPQGGAVG